MGKSIKPTLDTWKPSIIAEIKQKHSCPAQTQLQEKYKFAQEVDKMMNGQNKRMNRLEKKEQKDRYVEYLKNSTLTNGPKAKGELYSKIGATQSQVVANLLNRNEGFL